MTSQKIIEQFAEFMGWHWQPCEELMSCGACDYRGAWTNKITMEMIEGTDCYHQVPHDRGLIIYADEAWNPLKDWNHWRRVEERVMEDEELKYSYPQKLMDTIGSNCFSEMSKADLPTRCKALVSVLNKNI